MKGIFHRVFFYGMVFRKEGYYDATNFVIVGPKCNVWMNVTLSPSGENVSYIEGYVKNTEGEPLAGITVIAWTLEGYQFTTWKIFTDLSGYYKIGALGGRYYDVVATKMKEGKTEISCEKITYLSEEENSWVNFTIGNAGNNHEDGYISGYVYDRDHHVLADVRIFINGELGNTECFTDENGYYRVTVPGNDFYKIFASKDNYRDGYINNTFVSPGETTNVDIVLNYDNGFGWIAGQVRNFRGIPIEGASVTIVSFDSSLIVAKELTDESGYYNVTVPAHSYYILNAEIDLSIKVLDLIEIVCKYVYPGQTTIHNFDFPRLMIDKGSFEDENIQRIVEVEEQAQSFVKNYENNEVESLNPVNTDNLTPSMKIVKNIKPVTNIFNPSISVKPITSDKLINMKSLVLQKSDQVQIKPNNILVDSININPQLKSVVSISSPLKHSIKVVQS